MKKILNDMRNAVFVVLVVMTVIGCPAPGSGQITADELRSSLQAEGDALLVVDVRTRGEHQRGIIPGTDFLMPYEQIAVLWGTKNIAKDTPIIAYCAVGQRSEIAVDTLKKMGYSNVRSLAGGISAWARSGGKIGRP